MSIKSIKLKLYFSRKNTDHQIIWHTHQLINEGSAYYLRQLLLLRQKPIEDIVDPKSELIRIARTAQANNGRSRIGTDEEILATLRKLYEEIIPASVGKKSNAQVLSRAYLSILVDAKSIAGLGIAKKKKPGDPSSNPTLVSAKSIYGILPLFKSFSDSKPNWQKKSVCTTWDRDMFQQSLERLCSWESWNIRVNTERQKLIDQVAQMQTNSFTPIPAWAECIRLFEKDRKLELDAIALPSKNQYRILKSGIRGWKELRQQWIDEPNKSKDVLIEHIADVNRESNGTFGDPAVFAFLAQPKNHFIWDTPADNVTKHVEFNELLEKLEKSKQQAQFTLPDPLHHPVWIRLDGPGGNLHRYEIFKTADASYVRLWMLAYVDDQIVDREVQVPIARSMQWQAVQVKDYDSILPDIAESIKKQKNDMKVQWVQTIDRGTRKKFFGKLGGAKIQFERADLEKSKYYLDTYINISINYIPVIADDCHKAFTLVKPDETSPWTIVDIKPEKFEEQRWLGRSIAGIDGLKEGLRVMSVAIKIKTLAVCSIYEVTREEKGMTVAIAGTSWYARHKSSFILDLPGEKETKKIADKRRAIVAERITLKNKLKKLSRILTLAGKSKELREDYLKIFNKSDFIDENLLHEKIAKQVTAEQPEWQQCILTIHRELEHDLGKSIELWRKKYRRKSMELRNVCGLSIWWIRELVETRKLINAWSAHARAVREIVRARSLRGLRKDTKAREVDFDARLLKHTNNIKEDRVKKGADMIVMHALGYQYSTSKNRWVAQHPPCRIILFRDISDFKMDKSQSRRNNERLMAWSHRALPRHVASQGEIYGLLTGIVRTSSANQWHARCGAPAVRMIKVTEDYTLNAWFIKGVLNELLRRKKITKKEKKAVMNMSKTDKAKKILNYVQVGQWIPWEHGDALVTVDRDGKKVIGNATINTAQITQWLFWSRQMVITKIYCAEHDGTEWVPVHIGKRMEAAMGFGKLVLDEDKETYRWTELSKRQYDLLSGNRDQEADENSEEEAPVLGIKQTFYRDPTGIFFQNTKWVPAAKFWEHVEKVVDAAVNPSILTVAEGISTQLEHT
jgi:hypothetical protein